MRKGDAHDLAFRTHPNRTVSILAIFRGTQLVVPQFNHLQRQILLWHHNHPWHAHMGVKRTISLVTDAFYSPGIITDIKNFVSQRHSRQIMKAPSSTEAVLSPLPVPSACWRIVSLDVIPSLPRPPPPASTALCSLLISL